MATSSAGDAAHASAALVDAPREASERARSGEGDKPLADVLWFRDDLLDIEADCVERPNAGEGPRGAFIEMREWGAALRGQLAGSPHELSRT